MRPSSRVCLPIFQSLSQLASEFAIYLIVGVTEQDEINASLYCSFFIFGPKGELLGKHRKIKPTGTERIIWAEGDGSSLHTYQTPFGRIGGLICWENMMPEARLSLYQSGIDIYLAPTADARDSWVASMRHIACEGRCYVISCNQYFRSSDYPPELQSHIGTDPEKASCRGGTLIVSPFGQILAGPVYDQQSILMADLDLDALIQSRLDFDPIGHYSRPDLFEFKLRQPTARKEQNS